MPPQSTVAPFSVTSDTVDDQDSKLVRTSMLPARAASSSQKSTDDAPPVVTVFQFALFAETSLGCRFGFQKLIAFILLISPSLKFADTSHFTNRPRPR